MVDYVKMAATAKRLINKNGRSVTLTKKDRTAANSSKPWRGPGTSDITVKNVKAVIVPFDTEDVDNQLVRRGDSRAYVAASDTDPNLIEDFDDLLDGTDKWKIIDVSIINPGDKRIVYDMQLRK